MSKHDKAERKSCPDRSAVLSELSSNVEKLRQSVVRRSGVLGHAALGRPYWERY
ncbi:MAG: hypothetical protein QXH42_09680 [Thermoplasmata archaeon]